MKSLALKALLVAPAIAFAGPPSYAISAPATVAAVDSYYRCVVNSEPGSVVDSKELKDPLSVARSRARRKVSACDGALSVVELAIGIENGGASGAVAFAQGVAKSLRDKSMDEEVKRQLSEKQ